jgi:hypothetical protein
LEVKKNVIASDIFMMHLLGFGLKKGFASASNI